MKEFKSIYKDNTYFSKNQNWHTEDSDWKFNHIQKSISKINYKKIVDIGCGAGKILENFYNKNSSLELYGFDISDNIQHFWKDLPKKINFHHEDFLNGNLNSDLLLLIDVFEHIEDYYSFLRKINTRSKYFAFHIPLDLFVLASLTNNYTQKKKKLGHLHYFDFNTALGVLEDTGYKTLNYHFTKTYLQSQTKAVKILRPFRRIGEFLFGIKWNSKILGGYSLMVLCEKN
jgi:SAM-dependent methyltransferase